MFRSSCARGQTYNRQEWSKKTHKTVCEHKGRYEFRAGQTQCYLAVAILKANSSLASQTRTKSRSNGTSALTIFCGGR
jgi:hypothetical protein